jgi:hypothetical protein
MTFQTEGMRDLYTSEYQRTPLNKAMRIISETDPVQNDSFPVSSSLPAQ